MSEIEGSIRFEVLGPIRARIGDSDITVSARRDRIMLAMLLLHAPDPVPLSRLVEAVWDDEPPHNSRNQVQGCVSRWRKRFADADVQRQMIVTDQAGYRIPVQPPDLDLLEFRLLRDEARSAAADNRAKDAYDRYRAALGLWHGPAVAGIDSALVRRATAALDEEHVQAHEECLRLALDRNFGEPGALVAEIQALLHKHPYREALQADLLRALYRAGRQADALAAYRDYRRLLSEELGTEPGDELQRLHLAILNREAELDARKPSPPTAVPPVPRELPADVSGFTGRAEALAALDDLLPSEPTGTPGPIVISAIAGTAGVGKTALAVHWAHRVVDRFPDGQLYLNLRGYASGQPLRPVEALAALLRSLGVPSEQIPTDEAQAATLLRTKLADKRTLVVLDNARSVDQVRPLLPGSPGSLVLATSRDRLSGLVVRDGARRITLDVLTADEAHALLTRLLGVERAEAESDAIVELASACAHLPLAIRIAAAHIADRPILTIAAYVAELASADRLAALQVDGDQESSVLAILDLSYRALLADTARLFRLLGLMPGVDFTPAAAAALTNTSANDAARHLLLLSGAHLVSEPAPGRYAFHDLLRLFAKRLAHTHDGHQHCTAALELMYKYYAETADSATRLLYPQMLRLPPAASDPARAVAFDERATALAWLDAERANLVAASEHASVHGPRRQAWVLGDHLRRYFWHSRHTLDWLRAASAALKATEYDDNPIARAAAHISLADQYHCTSRYPESIQHYAIAVTQAAQAGWIDGQAAALINLGMVHYAQGRPADAAESYAHALTLYQRIGHAPGKARSHNNLGIADREMGQLQQAVEHHSEALALYEQLGYSTGEATALLNLGIAKHHLGQLHSAELHLARALTLAQELGDRVCTASALERLAAVHRDAGRLSKARASAQAGLALASDIGDLLTKASALCTLGSIELHLSQARPAIGYHQQALDLANEASVHSARSAAHFGLAEAYLHLDDHKAAYLHSQQALAECHKRGYRMLEGQALTLLTRIHFCANRTSDAIDCAQQALERHRGTGHQIGEAHTLYLLGQIRYLMGARTAAGELWSTATSILLEIGAHLPEGLRPPEAGWK